MSAQVKVGLSLQFRPSPAEPERKTWWSSIHVIGDPEFRRLVQLPTYASFYDALQAMIERGPIDRGAK